MSIERAEREGQEHEAQEAEAPVQKQAHERTQFKSDGPIPPVGGKFGALKGTADAAFPPVQMKAAPGVQFDKSKDKVKAENDKLADSSDGDRAKGHDDANLASAQGMGAAMDRVSYRMLSFEAMVNDTTRNAKSEEGRGFAGFTQKVKGEASAIKSDIDRLSTMISSVQVDGKMSTEHNIFARNLHQFKYGYISFRGAWFKAKDFVESHQDTWDEKTIDDYGFPTIVNSIFSAFGQTYDGNDGKRDDATYGRPPTDAAGLHGAAQDMAVSSVKENLEAATAAAHAIRSEVKKGDALRKTDTSRLITHVGEATRALAELDPKKTIDQKTVHAFLAEVDALQPALEQWHADEKEHLFGSGGSLTYNLPKIRAAAK